MKNLRKLSGLALALLGSAPCAAWAQPLPIPGAAGPLPAAAAAGPIAGAPVAAGPMVAAPGQTIVVNPQRNLWSFLCLPPAQRAALKSRFCNSQFGRLITNSMGPVSVFTGGVLPQCCPPIDPAGLALPPTTAAGAAAQIQKDTAEAAARRAAVRYLSTVDCNWWHEAREALSNALRADKNECVRLEAALALTRGCCCNLVTIKALVNALSVFPDDGNPREDSPRVRAAAMAALDHCLSCYVAVAAPPPPPPGAPGTVPPPVLPPGEGPPPKKIVPEPLVPPVPTAADARNGVRSASYRAAVPPQSMEQVVQQARRVLQQAKQEQAALRRHTPVGSYQPGDRCLLEVIENALHPAKPQTVIKTSYVAPPPAEFQQGNFAAPTQLKPVPQFAPASAAPQPYVIPAVSPPPLAAPVSATPISLNAPQPSAAMSTTAKLSAPPSAAPVHPEPSLPPPVHSTPAPKVVTYSAAPAAPKPATPAVRSSAQLVPPTPALDTAAGYEAVKLPVVKSAGTPIIKSVNSSASKPLTQLPAKASAPLPSTGMSTVSKPTASYSRLPEPRRLPPAPVVSSTAGPDLSPKPGSTLSSAALSSAAKPTYSPSVAPSASKPAASYARTPAPEPMPSMSDSMRPAATPSSLTHASYAHSESHLSTGATAKPAHPTVDAASLPTASVASAPAADVMPTSVSQPPSIYQLLEILRSSPQPKTRLWAAKSLSSQASATPTVVQALMSGASADTSDDVRDSCLQGLLQLGVYDPVLLAKVDWPRIDGDPRVREAVWQSILFGTETRDNPRVRDGAKALNQWFRSRSSGLRLTRG